MSSLHDERMARLAKVGLYPVISGPEFNAGRDYLETMELVLQGGAAMVQLRAKAMSDLAMLRLAQGARRLTEAYSALLIVDDRVDIALAAGADGVHVGQEDMPVDVARAIAPDLIIGASSHNLAEALRAQEQGASYVNIGPIFPTATKSGLPTFLGPEAIGQIAPKLKVPFTVMGGIKLENLHLVLEQGARIVAVVTAVTAQRDCAAAVRAFEQKMVRQPPVR